MSQVSTIAVASGSGLQVRQRLNASLEALLSLNSGPSAPANAVPFMLWADTTSGQVKVRNAANTAWVGLVVDLVLPQTLTAAQKTQARQNLDLDVVVKGAAETQYKSPNGSKYLFMHDNGLWGVQDTTSGQQVALGIAQGGTGGKTQATARAALGIGTMGVYNLDGQANNFLRGNGAWANFYEMMTTQGATGIGSFVFATTSAMSRGIGETIAGGNLQPCGIAGLLGSSAGFVSQGGGLPGTWRAHGWCNGAPGSREGGTLWQRIA